MTKSKERKRLLQEYRTTGKMSFKNTGKKFKEGLLKAAYSERTERMRTLMKTARKDVRFGFARYTRLDIKFLELKRRLQNGFVILSGCKDFDLEEENLTASRLLRDKLRSVPLKHVSLLGMYETNSDKNAKPVQVKKPFAMIPFQDGFTENNYMETVTKVILKHEQTTFYAKLPSDKKIKMYRRKKSSDTGFEEIETDWLSIEDVLENGLAVVKQKGNKELYEAGEGVGENKTEIKCVFKGYRVPSSWINAVNMERSGTLWL